MPPGQPEPGDMTLSLRNRNLLAFIGKSISGILLCTVLSHFLGHWIDYPWSLVALMVVLSPEGKDVLDLALTRIKGNCVGAAVSLYACDRLGLNVAAHSALAAMIIVLIQREGAHPWEGRGEPGLRGGDRLPPGLGRHLRVPLPHQARSPRARPRLGQAPTRSMKDEVTA
jgi:hypothetical protein